VRESHAEMLTYPCESCGAEVGVWCVSKSGRRATYLHVSRWWQWRNDVEGVS
jgi:hypothetical protein